MARTKSNEISLKKVVDLALKGKDLASSLKISKEQVALITSQKVFIDALEAAKIEASKITFFLVDDISGKNEKIELEVKAETQPKEKRTYKPRTQKTDTKAEVIKELKISKAASK